MKKRNFELLYYFMNENVILTEIKRSDLSNEKDKSKIYSWIKINPHNQEAEFLTYQSMSVENINGNEINVRTFSDGELRFDQHFAKFQHKSEGYIVMNCNTTDVPEVFLDKISSLIQGH
ncbi:hypothetical protein [Halobacteriovorax sp. JY17]|uniref:hypothetical protein n=1 Tax=Halobacteriovorax sp. JY17 TaxID=2014617 RepID=UPI000C5E8583|nr:hypothetical protein [Halobacteriovorax sp. JY17]PIK14019.1 MAG: hypothetical protein CES88_13630 [Halobacteriovorax sp. JY17]